MCTPVVSRNRSPQGHHRQCKKPSNQIHHIPDSILLHCYNYQKSPMSYNPLPSGNPHIHMCLDKGIAHPCILRRSHNPVSSPIPGTHPRPSLRGIPVHHRQNIASALQLHTNSCTARISRSDICNYYQNRQDSHMFYDYKTKRVGHHCHSQCSILSRHCQNSSLYIHKQKNHNNQKCSRPLQNSRQQSSQYPRQQAGNPLRPPRSMNRRQNTPRTRPMHQCTCP